MFSEQNDVDILYLCESDHCMPEAFVLYDEAAIKLGLLSCPESPRSSCEQALEDMH